MGTPASRSREPTARVTWRRGTLVGLAVAAGILVGIIIATTWLPGPRAAVPTLFGSPQLSPSSVPSPTARPAGLPDPDRTPGSINPAASDANLADTVCSPGWAATQRPPSAYTSALKFAQIIEYGYVDRDRSHYQEDHLVPLELGGAPRDPRNLWPQPNEARLSDGTLIGANEKDDLEDELHRRVCSEVMTLADAQRLIAGNWIDAWVEVGRP